MIGGLLIYNHDGGNMNKIISSKFVDMIIGNDYCDVKNLDGAENTRSSAPADWIDEIDELRGRCKEYFLRLNDTEFTVVLDKRTILRVSQMFDVNQNDVFFIRRSSEKNLEVGEIGLPKPFLDNWRNSELRGLILIAGEMGNGKTSTAASLIVDRLKNFGGLAIALEDPLETLLEGTHGNIGGRCVQVQASRKSGGFKEHLIRTMRTGADLIFVGEIRDGDTAEQVAIGALNGHLMIATLHAQCPATAIERLITLVKSGQSGLQNADDIVATGISMVLTQSLVRVPSQNESGRYHTRLSAEHLILTGSQNLGLKEKIRSGKIQSLNQDIETQARQSTFG